jgi:SAM-dependent methyltransferase
MPVAAPSEPVFASDPGFRHPQLALFLISFALLFLELACIRWFASTVVFLTFFTNIVLLACVLGMSAGCLAASRRIDYLEALVPLTLLAVLLAQGVLWSYRHDRMGISVGNNEATPEQVYFGTETPGLGRAGSIVPIEIIAGVFFALIALVFVGPGQALGRALGAIPDRLTAYAINIAGSLAGILAFSLASYACTPPALWFAVALIPLLGFLKRLVWLQVLGALAVLILVGREPAPAFEDEERVFWSPYYKVVYQPESGRIATNNIGHQQMRSLGMSGAAYMLPNLLNRDCGRPSRSDVLIIGAGSGNDVQAALLGGARHVDAVEIDPLLYEIGRADHPDHPYQDPRVSVYLDDGRSYLRRTRRTYDQITYALVDSLVLHSAYSSLRLESFLFTEEAFRQVRERLKPEGVFVMYNYFRQGFVVSRLAAMAERVFRTPPIVLSLPYRARIRPDQRQVGFYTVMIMGRTEAALATLRARFAQNDWFWLNVDPRKHEGFNGFRREPPEPAGPLEDGWLKIGPAVVDTAGAGPLATDDWPFLYLRRPTIPALNLRGIALMAGIAVLIVRLGTPARALRPNGQMFFLGAAFMLLETRGVVQLALLFGSTWIVNALVFAAILVMVLLSNLYVLAVRPRRTRPYYVLLFAALVLNMVLPPGAFLALPLAPRTVAVGLVVFVPIFFAGAVFAVAFRGSPRPDVDLGSNIGGVVLGGLSEYLSLVVGLSGLLWIALGYYLLSALLAPRPVENRAREGV